MWWNSIPNYSEIEPSAAELLRCQCLTSWPWTCFTCWAMLWIIFTKFKLSQPIRLCHVTISAAITWCQSVTLTCDQLILTICNTSNVTWSKSVRNFSEIEQSPVELLIILLIFAPVKSLYDHDLWHPDLELLKHFEGHVFKLCTKIRAKSHNPQLSDWRFSTFSQSARLLRAVYCQKVQQRLLRPSDIPVGWLERTQNFFIGGRPTWHPVKRRGGSRNFRKRGAGPFSSLPLLSSPFSSPFPSPPFPYRTLPYPPLPSSPFLSLPSLSSPLPSPSP